MSKQYPIKARIRAEAGAPTRVDIFDDIGNGGMFSDGLTAKDFAAQISSVKGPLDVHINSGGGSVADGIAIANAVRAHQGRKRTIVDGMAASIASIIMQAGDERVVEPGAMVMIHDASTMAAGTAADFAKMADDLNKHSDNLAKQYADRAGGTPEQWRSVMKAETWFSADEAVAAGLADRVGAGRAALPAGFDLAAFDAVPGRIVAHLRAMPTLQVRAATEAAGHGMFTGTHTHAHNSHDGPDGDGDGFHVHEHTHAGEDHHHHEHPDGDAAGVVGHAHPHVQQHTHAHARAAYQPQPYERDNGEDVQCPVCGKYNEDDAIYCDQCSLMLAGRDDVQGAPSRPGGADALDAAACNLIRAGLDADAVWEIVNAAVDESDWDGPHAMSLAAKSDDPAATYKQICAGRRDGDAALRSSWALPYKYPGKPPNRAGVRNALGRLPQTQGLTNETEARTLLQRLMKQINPDYQPEDHAALPAWLTAHHDDPAPAPAWLNPA